MTIRMFLGGTIAGMIVSWTVWLLIILWIDPHSADHAEFSLFFLALFLALTATCALVGYAVRRFLDPRQLPAYQVRIALRQGLWIGVFANILLFLQYQQLLRWWIAGIIVILVLSLELIFLSYDRSGKHHKTSEEGS